MSILMKNLDLIIEEYNNAVKNLPKLHMIGGGKARNGSGVIFENFVQKICSSIDLVAKKNDYKKSKTINGYFVKNLQVDKHIYRDGIMVKAVESKCYLDSCYCKRAVLDFIELYESPDVSKDVEYAILTGQSCVAKDSLNYYSAMFTEKTGKKLNVFVINKHKKRSGKRPIYAQEFNDDFQLDINEVNRFVEWLKS